MITERNSLGLPCIKGINKGHLHSGLTANELEILGEALEKLCTYEENDLRLRYHITKNPFDFHERDIFTVGKRSGNKKRSFLFISKLLGKHLPVKPQIVRATGFFLASLKYGFDNHAFVDFIKNPEMGIENTCYHINNDKFHMEDETDRLVIGFCETATGLGMAVASAINGCTYISSTREPICKCKVLLSFEEGHSHATSHDILSHSVDFHDFKRITLVDDEITTGKTLLNLIEKIESISHMEEYDIMTILDWRDSGRRKAFEDFEKEHDVKINVYSAIEGEIDDVPFTTYTNGVIHDVTTNYIYDSSYSIGAFERVCVNTIYGQKKYITLSGRFGVEYDEIADDIENTASHAVDFISQILPVDASKILVLGHGENIYIPSRIAAYLESDYHYQVDFRTTSLSPVYCDGYVIKDVVSYISKGQKYYFYNQKEAEQKYDTVIMCGDDEKTPMLCNNMLYVKL